MAYHILPLFFMIALIVSCGQPNTAPTDIPEAPAPRYTGDLPDLREKGKLRVIVRPDPIEFMPRNAEPVSIDRDIAEGLAASLGLDLELVVSNDYSKMTDMLIEGQGDVIAAGLTETDTRREKIAFSVPYLFVDELLVVVESDSMPQSLADLAGYEIAVRRASSNAETASEIKLELPGLRIRELAETLNTEEIVERVSQGTYPATITDSNYWAVIGGYYDNLKTPVTVAADSPVGLGLRRESTELRTRVDEYLHARFLTRDRESTYKDDLSGIKQRGRLRMITRNNALTYFIHQGREIGFEYEMMRRFAEQQGLRLEIVIPPSHDEVIDYLNDGRGDIVAAAMTITDDRERQAVFSKAYMEVDEVVVVRTADSTVARPQDLSGKTIHLRASSSFYGSLKQLQQTVPGITIVTLPEDTETEEVLAAVEEGTYDITVSDSNLLQVEQAYGRQLRSAFSVKPAQLGWAVRNNNEELLTALNDFIDTEYKGLFYNMMLRRYFRNQRNIGRALDSKRSDITGTISPFDTTIKKYASRFDLDWRLIVAQMYQESKFNPTVESWVGAQGLMQVMPATARELGVGDVTKPEPAIHAGVKYLSQMLNRFDKQIPLEERIRFALAAYNAGYGHVLDARRLASQSGLDPDQWFDNVEVGIRMLEKPEFFRKARYGYCRGGEPAQYVRLIQSRYEAYVNVLEASSPQ